MKAILGAAGSHLSVPYFTGFVMLLLHQISRTRHVPPFSPLFYGIRDVTPFIIVTRPSGIVSFSPLFYGIRDVTYGMSQQHSLHAELSVPYFTGFVMLQ